jgi:hypothetical protein
MLKLLLSALMNSGIGERDSENRTSDFRDLVGAYTAEKEKKKGMQSLDRLQDAFAQLKDMHKDNPQTPVAPFGSSAEAGPFDNAQWPYGPQGAPSQASASAAPPAPPPGVPMPAPRPAEAPQASSPFADFFARNTALMKDPGSGEFIDPRAAALHGGGLSGMFG